MLRLRKTLSLLHVQMLATSVRAGGFGWTWMY